MSTDVKELAKGQTGRIKKGSWNAAKGIAFIVPSDGSADVFVHKSAFKGGYATPADDDSVTYDLTETPKGLRAENVRKANGSTTAAPTPTSKPPDPPPAPKPPASTFRVSPSLNPNSKGEFLISFESEKDGKPSPMSFTLMASDAVNMREISTARFTKGQNFPLATNADGKLALMIKLVGTMEEVTLIIRPDGLREQSYMLVK